MFLKEEILSHLEEMNDLFSQNILGYSSDNDNKFLFSMRDLSFFSK